MANCNGLHTFLMDQVVQVGQSNSQNGWYEYNFNNVILPNEIDSAVINTEPLEIVEHNNSKSKSTPVSDNSAKTSPVERVYICKICSAAFANSSNLKSHSRIHSGEKPYTCDECGISFVQSSNMKAHKRIHTGERPYKCRECGQSFSRSSHLTGHKRTHTGERPYICGVCKESFVTSTHLRNHMRKHTGEKPFLCVKCGATFAQNTSLKIHMRTHTGERPFKCEDCKAAFRSSGDLRSHRKLHTTDRKFSCSKCNKHFKTKQYLQKHNKKCGAPPSGKKRGRPKTVILHQIVEPDVKKSENKVVKSKGKFKRERLRRNTIRLSRHSKVVDENGKMIDHTSEQQPLLQEDDREPDINNRVEYNYNVLELEPMTVETAQNFDQDFIHIQDPPQPININVIPTIVQPNNSFVFTSVENTQCINGTASAISLPPNVTIDNIMFNNNL